RKGSAMGALYKALLQLRILAYSCRIPAPENLQNRFRHSPGPSVIIQARRGAKMQLRLTATTATFMAAMGFAATGASAQSWSCSLNSGGEGGYRVCGTQGFPVTVRNTNTHDSDVTLDGGCVYESSETIVEITGDGPDGVCQVNSQTNQLEIGTESHNEDGSITITYDSG